MLQFVKNMVGMCKNLVFSTVGMCKNLLFKVMDFVNLLDANKKLSLSNIAVSLILFKLAQAKMAEVSWEMLVTSGIVFVNYLGKRMITNSAMVKMKKLEGSAPEVVDETAKD